MSKVIYNTLPAWKKQLIDNPSDYIMSMFEPNEWFDIVVNELEEANCEGPNNGFYGKTHTEAVRKIISNTHKDVPKSKSHIDNIRKTMSDGRQKGANNAHAKKWILTTPSDEIIEIHGSLHETCKKLNINAPFLVRHLNKRVPYIKWRGGKHGAPGTEAYKIRMNTVGFKLEKVCTNT